MTSEPASVPTQPDPRAIKARKRRNIWLALALFTFVVLMGVGTAIRIGQGAGTDPCKPSLYWNADAPVDCPKIDAEPG